MTDSLSFSSKETSAAPVSSEEKTVSASPFLYLYSAFSSSPSNAAWNTKLSSAPFFASFTSFFTVKDCLFTSSFGFYLHILLLPRRLS